MDDNDIIRMYWDRNGQAIAETSDKYGRYCARIAQNILGSGEDAEECVNDTWLNAWNAMPEHWPQRLASFLGKITRNLCFSRYQQSHAEKRGGGETALVLDELADCVSGRDSVEQILDRQALIGCVNSFVRELPRDRRNLFVRRYWYADAVSEIARDHGMTPGAVSKALERMRKRLRAYLTERGFTI